MDVTQLRPTGEKYKLYTGTYAQAMPQLIADGRRPATIEDIVNARNETFSDFSAIFGSDPKEIMKMRNIESVYNPTQLNVLFFWANYFHTANGFYNKELVLSPPDLLNANTNSELHEGGLVVAEPERLIASSADGTIKLIDKDTMGEEVSDIFCSTPRQEKYSKWYFAMRGNNTSLNKYIINVMKLVEVLGYNYAQTMEIHPPMSNDLMPVAIRSVLKGSALYGKNPMDKANARLIGIKD